jgi:SprT protein
MCDLDLQSKAIAKTQQLLRSAELHFNLPPCQPEITFNLRGKAAGLMVMRHNGSSTIRYNSALLQHYGQRFIEQTIPHEVAHLIARIMYGAAIKPHGNEWRSIMAFFNTPAERCHRYDTSQAGVRTMRYFEYQCDCRTHQVSAIRHNRIRSGVTYLCRACGANLR